MIAQRLLASINLPAVKALNAINSLSIVLSVTSVRGVRATDRPAMEMNAIGVAFRNV